MNGRKITDLNGDIDSFWKIHPKHIDWIFIVATYIVLSLFVFPLPGN